MYTYIHLHISGRAAFVSGRGKMNERILAFSLARQLCFSLSLFDKKKIARARIIDWRAVGASLEPVQIQCRKKYIHLPRIIRRHTRGTIEWAGGRKNLEAQWKNVAGRRCICLGIGSLSFSQSTYSQFSYSKCKSGGRNSNSLFRGSF